MKDNKSAYNSGIYDDRIINVLPYYKEFHGQIIDLVRNMKFSNPNWLDTGCGTGTLARRVLEERNGSVSDHYRRAYKNFEKMRIQIR